MPPKRKTSRQTTASAPSQPRLSFGKQSKVTKPSAKDTSTKAAKKEEALAEAIQRNDVDLHEPTTAEKVIQKQAEHEASQLDTVDIQVDPLEDSQPTTAADVLGGTAPSADLTGAVGGATDSGWLGEEEQKARKISDAAIKKYWRTKESERLAPRVHQEGLSVYDKVLREWDMSGQYGPCIGIARLKRWKRANMLGLHPPMEVLAVMLKEMDGDNAVKSQRAYVDELMSSRFVET